MSSGCIKDFLNDPEGLEQRYRADKSLFAREFRDLYPEIADAPVAAFWKARLDASVPSKILDASWLREVIYLLSCFVLVSVLIKLPVLLGMDQASTAFFYGKNVALIVFAGLALFAFYTRPSFRGVPLYAVLSVFLMLTLYVNLLPPGKESHTIQLVYLHLPMLLWCVYGLVFLDFQIGDRLRIMDYVKHNGEMLVWGVLIVVAGSFLAGITLLLFSVIGMQIEKFYMEYVVVCGAVSAPVLATFLIRWYPVAVSRLTPILADVFSPLVLITLLIYLIAFPLAGKDPFHDRAFLMACNLMLFGVLALIVYSVTGASLSKWPRFNGYVLFSLAIVAGLIDLVALSAIVYRLGEYGASPNRLVVLGWNVLILSTLLMVVVDLFRVQFRKTDMSRVERTVVRFVPAYVIWVLIILIVFPLVFGV